MYIPLEDGEEIVLKVHKHWWFMVLRATGVLALMVVPLLLWALISHLNALNVNSLGLSNMGLVAIATLWLVVGWVVFWQFWTIWYMDMWVVTDRRLIDIDYKGFFDRDIAILRLDKVQDLSVQVRGIAASTLGYGTILVQTAATREEFMMDDISDPEHLRDTISSLIGTAKHQQP